MSSKEHSCYSDELQDKRISGGSRHRRCCIACAVVVMSTLVLFGIAILVVWYMLFGRLDTVAAEAAKAGRIKGDNFTAADWERVIRGSGPVDFGWEKDAFYELVGYTDNMDDYLLAMGARSWELFIARLPVERFTIHKIDPNGVITFYWKFLEFVEREWKFHLGTEFTTTFGRNLGRSNQTCKMLRPNALRCEERHSEHRHWHVFTTFEFYKLGILRIHELPYKDNMIITKFYERLFSLKDIAKKPTSGSSSAYEDGEESNQFWEEDEWSDNWK